MKTITDKMLAALAAISLFPQISFAEDPFKIEAAASLVDHALALKDKHSASLQAAPCDGDESLDFARFHFVVKGNKGEPQIEMDFRFTGCSKSPGANGRSAAVRTYEGTKGFNLSIATDEGAAKSRLVLMPASFLGEIANQKLAEYDPIDLGQITIPDPSDPKQKKTGTGTLERSKLSGNPTDHRCDPAIGCAPGA